MYPFIRGILFLLEPEKAHHLSMKLLKWINRSPLSFILRIFRTEHKALERNVFGLRFANPVGLGAGFDKNAQYLSELQALGFGFVEIGTVTPLPQPGNEKPRLFRLPKDRALINRMGFNNAGVDTIAANIRRWRESDKGKKSKMIIGGNIGKNKVTSNEDAWKDYVVCFEKLFDHVDYFVVNVSSPNTPGLRELQQKSSLLKIFGEIGNINKSKKHPKPVLLKIAPDLAEEDLIDIVSACGEMDISGLVISNTTVSREGLLTSSEPLLKIGAGGLSGAPLKSRSSQLLEFFLDKTAGKISVIASGGILTSSDAMERLNAGASLVQVWTGFVYEGPSIVKKILKHLKTEKQ
jgi:dihydroorotate dehydrogenase